MKYPKFENFTCPNILTSHHNNKPKTLRSTIKNHISCSFFYPLMHSHGFNLGLQQHNHSSVTNCKKILQQIICNHFHITHNKSETNMQLKLTCKWIDNISTKIVTQDIPWETLIEKKTQPPKASITIYYLEKISVEYNHGGLQSHSHNQAIHIKNHEYTYLMPYF